MMWQGFGVVGNQLEEAMLPQWLLFICIPVYFANMQAGTTCGASSQLIRPRIISSFAYLKIFVTFATKVPYFNILRQKVTNFDVGNGERMRKWREREEMERE